MRMKAFVILLISFQNFLAVSGSDIYVVVVLVEGGEGETQVCFRYITLYQKMTSLGHF